MSRKQRKKRKISKRILVLCEGPTEKQYLLSIKNLLPREKQRSISIEIESYKKTDPKSLTNESIRRKKKANRENSKYDSVWIVFDHDNSPNRDYAFIKAKKEKINIAYSSINIEMWFILHFEYTSRSFETGDIAKNYLADNYIDDYKPGKTIVWDYLRQELTKKAMKYAHKLRKYQIANLENGVKEWDLNPYVTIDKLVEYLLSLD